MTTPLMPVKSILSSAVLTPKDLIDDKDFEDWLFADLTYKRLGFIKAVMQGWRAGLTSITYEFSSHEDAIAMRDYIQDSATNKYKYTVTGPSEPSGKSITVSWV